MSNISDSVCFRKINPIKCVIMLLLAIAAVFNAVVADFVDSLVFIGLLGLVIVQVKFRNRSIAAVVSVFSVLLFTSYFSQLLIVVGTDIAKIGKSALWFLFYLHDSTSILMNFALVLLFYIVLKTFGIKDKIVMMITPIPFLFLTLVDYFVVCYRGTELVAADFYSANTALDVISGHQLIFVYPIIYVFIPLIAFEYIVFVSETDTERKINLRYYVISTVRTVACVAVFAVFFRFYTNNHNVTTYGISPSMYNTFMNNFALSISILHPKAPVDYSLDYINENTADLVTNVSSGEISDDVNIIVIMNEAYADINLYDDKLNNYIDNMPYFNELKADSNSISGYYLSSIYGGNTANSEFEFLTGMSMAYFPSGTVPYALYVRDNVVSLPNYLKSQNYFTIGMHPARASNYNREKVYEYLGFDKKMFIDDFEIGNDGYIRDLCSDRSAYTELLRMVDDEHQNGNNRIFAFLVTIQNHSSFENCYDFSNFIPKQYISSQELAGNDVTQLNGYLSLINESDKALEMLIEELKERDEKYVVFIFGDHQPSVSGWEHLSTYVQQQYEVPFLLWANYDIDESVKECIQDSFVNDDFYAVNTSINYCLLDVLRYAGLPLSPLYLAIDECRQEMPIVSANWYYNLQSKSLEEVRRDENSISTLSRLYEYIQYDFMFDEANSSIMP